MRQFAQLLSLHSCSLLQASTAYRCYSVPTAKRVRLLLLGQARELGGLYLLALALLALLPLSLGQLGSAQCSDPVGVTTFNRMVTPSHSKQNGSAPRCK